MERPVAPQLIVLFDGECNLCHSSVRFVIRHDPQARFRFASLQSAMGRQLAKRHGIDSSALNSMLFVEDGRLYEKSTAALRIARRLRWPWPFAYSFIVVPGVVRNAIYDFVGRHRYRWFGKRDYCAISQAGEEHRFLSGRESN